MRLKKTAPLHPFPILMSRALITDHYRVYIKNIPTNDTVPFLFTLWVRGVHLLYA